LRQSQSSRYFVEKYAHETIAWQKTLGVNVSLVEYKTAPEALFFVAKICWNYKISLA
jgi:hypothetical protein